MEKKDKIAMLEQSLDRKLTTLEMYENRPRKWILYLVIVLAVTLLVGWSADDIHFTGLTATGTEVAKGVLHGVFHPDTNLLFGTGDSDVPYLLLQTIAIAVLGTIFGAILAIPFAFLASFNIMPKAVAYIVRILILMIRTIPSIVWALMWIRVTGPGAACGVITQNIGEFIAAPFIHAVGGSWVCPKADIAAGNFEKITELCKQARSAALGFEVAHIGVNCENADAASAVCEKLNEAFDLPVKDGSSSMFASSGIEVMKTMFKGKNGHIAIRTNSVELAVAELAKKGFAYDESSAKYKNGRMTVAYLKDEFGGFAVHLLQK